MPTWMASGPGSDWQMAIDSRICSFDNHPRSATNSRPICFTRATGPPKPRAEAQKVDREFADTAGVGGACVLMKGYPSRRRSEVSSPNKRTDPHVRRFARLHAMYG